MSQPLRQSIKTASPKILFFSSSDSGGAGIGARRLHESLRAHGLGNLMYVGRKHSETQGVYVPPVPGQKIVELQSGGMALENYLLRERSWFGTVRRQYPNCSNNLEYFTIPGQSVNLDAVPLFADADVISLHWISGFLDPALSADLLAGKKLTWTVRDQNPFTGGCHYTGDCVKYTEHCGSCPLLGSSDPHDLSHTIWRNRMSAFRKLDIHVVCTTRWMAEKVRASSLLGKKDVSVIPNTVPLNIFYPMRREAIRKDLSFAENDFIMMFSSQSLTNYRKGGHFILEALRKIADGPDGKRTKILLLGQNPDEAFFSTGIEVLYCGYLTDMQQLAVYYNAADVFLFPSLEEAFGQVTAEAAACGTPTVAFAAGGIPETIEHGVTGWLAPTGSLEGLLEGIRWARDAAGDPKMRKQCRILAMERWGPENTTYRYAKLFQELAEKS